MPSPRRTSPLVYASLLACCLVPPALVLSNLSWLKQQPDNTVFLITGIAGAMAILAGLAINIVHDRGMGEWERSNQRFATFWGDAVGTSFVALLLCLPAGREWIVAVVSSWAHAETDQLVILGFVLGFATLVITRVVCMAALSIGWTLWKSRAPRAS